ncbi:hypothetical protein CMV_023235 [Castanea mollissima]|uniref:Arginyl-tRNA synthetase catalytic core domain-containing protein n=1 Tax=Castanea mollissima TaxID=60419 RepID=A0A8J4QKM3_9ROSI|nr:hypothetical protein CMV_023235 [Castanea mollissima]
MGKLLPAYCILTLLALASVCELLPMVDGKLCSEEFDRSKADCQSKSVSNNPCSSKTCTTYIRYFSDSNIGKVGKTYLHTWARFLFYILIQEITDREAWTQICEISRNEFNRVYQRLGVQLEEKGESLYNPYIPNILNKLTSINLVEESQGARVIFLEGEISQRSFWFNYCNTLSPSVLALTAGCTSAVDMEKALENLFQSISRFNVMRLIDIFN